MVPTPSSFWVLRQFRCRIFCATFCQSAYWARSAFILGKICFLRTGLAHSLWPTPHCVVDSAGKVCPLKSDFAQKYEWPRPKAPQTLPVVIRLLFPCTESDEEPQKEQVGNRVIYNYLNSSILQKWRFQTPVATPKTTEIARLHCLAILCAPGGSTFICWLSACYKINKLKRKLYLSITTFGWLPWKKALS